MDNKAFCFSKPVFQLRTSLRSREARSCAQHFLCKIQYLEEFQHRRSIFCVQISLCYFNDIIGVGPVKQSNSTSFADPSSILRYLSQCLEGDLLAHVDLVLLRCMPSIISWLKECFVGNIIVSHKS